MFDHFKECKCSVCRDKAARGQHPKDADLKDIKNDLLEIVRRIDKKLGL